MDPEEVLRRHLEICRNAHQLLLEENSWLKKNKTLPSEELLARKQEMLPLLEQSLAHLKKLQPEEFSPFSNCKELVNASHDKLMQIFYLDRENEDLMVGVAEPPADRAQFTRFTEPDEINEFHGVDDLPPEAPSSDDRAPQDEPPSSPSAEEPGGGRLA
mgnify:CR=1 FL=1